MQNERRIGALEGQIYGVAARTQINLICVRTLAERGHVGAGLALAEPNGGNACRPESSLRHRSWSHPRIAPSARIRDLGVLAH